MTHFPWQRRGTRRRMRAFTLIELLVSMTVLVLLVTLIGQLVNSATSVTIGNRERLDADAQARIVFDRMAFDFSKMLKRPDVDYLFAKIDGANGGGNDKMFFYSEAPAFYDGDPAKPSARSSVALLGYRINAGYQLERLGKLLTWDGPAPTTTGTSTPGGIMFLTPADATIPWIFDPHSTLAGNWPATVGAPTDLPPYTPTTDDPDYHVLAEQVCRMEFCFQLTDGSYSTIPVAPVTSPNALKNSLNATRAPAKSDDLLSGNFVPGARWYDTTAGRGYVCVSNTTNAAVWANLGMQDVRGIVVALAILDGTSAKIVPSESKTFGGTAHQVPKLTNLMMAFADGTTKDITVPNGQPNDQTIPYFSHTTSVPTRSMSEAWNKEIGSAGFAAASGLPLRAAEQVRVYQRTFLLNSFP